MDHHHPPKIKKTGKARIPDHLRRRALVSCDRCKKRRIRCLRSSASDANEPCQSCLEVGVGCESTLPRKTRIYGSVETLSARYRVLDTLIKGLFPDRDTNSIETLNAIAEAHEIQLPTFDDRTVAEEVFSQPAKQSAPSPSQSAADVTSPSVASRESENSDWFQKEPVDQPWDLKDFFGAEGFVNAGPVVTTQGFENLVPLQGVYQPVPTIGELGEELMVPPHTAYAQYSAAPPPHHVSAARGALDGPFGGQRLGNGMPKGPGML
ncbi:hypothetical protein LZ554_002191 [Drepanopeziza brunnea f. sp. 'monogermtubi']|nr:hypothetical protein LZ554_002191 [Drepanopeziza brunnea f. sp. 'monogermtubi']